MDSTTANRYQPPNLRLDAQSSCLERIRHTVRLKVPNSQHENKVYTASPLTTHGGQHA